MIRRRPLVLLAVPAALLPAWLLARAYGGSGAGTPALAVPHPAATSGQRAPEAESGLSELETQVRARPTDAVLRTRAGAEYGRGGDYARAKHELTRAVLLDPRLPEAWHNLGLAYLNSYEPDQALKQFRRELELRPGDAGVHLAIGQAYLSLRNPTQSVRHLRLASRLRPEDGETAIWLARAHHFAGDLAAAERVLKEAARILPDSAYVWYLLGRLYASEQRYTEALAAAREAVRLDPARPHHYLLLAQAFEHRRVLDEAIRAYRQALALDPALASGHAQLGHALVLRRRYRDALPHLRRALEGDMESSRLRLDLATAYRALGDSAAADREFAAVRSDQLSEATLKVFRKRAELQPRNAAAWYQFGRACARAGRNEAAETALRTTLRLRPADSAARRLLESLQSRREPGAPLGGIGVETDTTGAVDQGALRPAGE